MFGLFGGAKKKRLLKSIALIDRCEGLMRIQIDSPEAVNGGSYTRRSFTATFLASPMRFLSKRV
jgi:hypothetical protein